jgi:hypothetical protein
MGNAYRELKAGDTGAVTPEACKYRVGQNRRYLSPAILKSSNPSQYVGHNVMGTFWAACICTWNERPRASN